MAKKFATEQMWTVFKQVFAEEYHNLVEETKVTSEDAGFNLDNAMQEIGVLLENLNMVAVADNDTVTKLSEAVEALMQNNASLTAHLSNTMRMSLYISEKLNIKPMQEPKDKRLAEMAKRKAEFDKNLDTYGY